MRNLLYFAQPILVSLTTFNRLRTPVERRPMSLPKRKRKKKEKEEKLQRFALNPEHGPRGIWLKPLKPDVLNLHWLGVTDFGFATLVDGRSLASCRCWRLEIIRSPG